MFEEKSINYTPVFPAPGNQFRGLLFLFKLFTGDLVCYQPVIVPPLLQLFSGLQHTNQKIILH
jgi:hypothetical protein